jgi:hypothetical protein
VAVQHWGEPRVTRDLDLTVFTGFGGETPVVDGLLARIPAYAHRLPPARDHRTSRPTRGRTVGSAAS